ncbi:hypothetical protein FRC08_014629, partial [Ceratobasidium sp. 394]
PSIIPIPRNSVGCSSLGTPLTDTHSYRPTSTQPTSARGKSTAARTGSNAVASLVDSINRATEERGRQTNVNQSLADIERDRVNLLADDFKHGAKLANSQYELSIHREAREMVDGYHKLKSEREDVLVQRVLKIATAGLSDNLCQSLIDKTYERDPEISLDDYVKSIKRQYHALSQERKRLGAREAGPSNASPIVRPADSASLEGSPVHLATGLADTLYRISDE